MASGISDFLNRIFGGSRGDALPQENPEEFVDYKGFQIRPQPRRDNDSWNVAGTIRKETEDGPQAHYFLRADSAASREAAVELTVMKAKQMIDLEGERLFTKRSDRHAS